MRFSENPQRNFVLITYIRRKHSLEIRNEAQLEKPLIELFRVRWNEGVVMAEGEIFVGIEVFCDSFKVPWRKDAKA